MVVLEMAVDYLSFCLGQIQLVTCLKVGQQVLKVAPPLKVEWLVPWGWPVWLNVASDHV